MKEKLKQLKESKNTLKLFKENESIPKKVEKEFKIEKIDPKKALS